MDRPIPPTALCQVPLKPLLQVLRKAVKQPDGPGVLAERESSDVSMTRAAYPLLWAAGLRGCLAVWSISHHRGYCSR